MYLPVQVNQSSLLDAAPEPLDQSRVPLAAASSVNVLYMHSQISLRRDASDYPVPTTPSQLADADPLSQFGWKGCRQPTKTHEEETRPSDSHFADRLSLLFIPHSLTCRLHFFFFDCVHLKCHTQIAVYPPITKRSSFSHVWALCAIAHLYSYRLDPLSILQNMLV